MSRASPPGSPPNFAVPKPYPGMISSFEGSHREDVDRTRRLTMKRVVEGMREVGNAAVHLGCFSRTCRPWASFWIRDYGPRRWLWLVSG
eukprot:24169-Amorphochlora_amoeboformis.AAC.1